MPCMAAAGAARPNKGIGPLGTICSGIRLACAEECKFSTPITGPAGATRDPPLQAARIAAAAVAPIAYLAEVKILISAVPLVL